MSAPIDPRCFGTDAYSLRHILYVYLSPFLATIGTIGDVLLLMTIHYGHLEDSPYVYLRCIAVGDLILMAWHASTWVFMCKSCNFTVTTMYYLKAFRWYCYIGVAFFMETWLLFLTLFMTMERFVYVRWPMQTRSLCTRGRAKKISIAVLLVTAISQAPFLIRMQTSVYDKAFAKLGSSFRYSEFRCKPTGNETLLASQFNCYNWKYPVQAQSNEIDPRCSNDSFRFDPDLQWVPRTSQSLYTLDCLHKFCELPKIPEGISFTSVSDFDDSRILYTTTMNAKIIAMTNGSSSDGLNHLLPREKLFGRAMYVNETCTFLLASPESKVIYSNMSKLFFDDFTDTVQCIRWRERTDWLSFLGPYWRAWEWRRETFTVLLTAFNVAIVVVLRRANRQSAEGVLPSSRQNVTHKRRAEENRLTMSLVLVSAVKIVRDVLYNTCRGSMARSIYRDVNPAGLPLRIHSALAYAIDVVEWSSSFYLFAFCNRKFKEEFLQRVVHGKLEGVLSKHLRWIQTLSGTSETTSIDKASNSGREVGTAPHMGSSGGKSDE